MEQQDSLKLELQNLSRLQTEQINILRKMSEGSQTEKALQDAKNMAQNVQFNSPNMYSNAANQFGPPQSQQYTYAYNNPFNSPNNISLTHGMSQGFVNNASTLFGGDSKFGFLAGLNPGTQYSMMSRDLIRMDHSSRLSQATTTGIGAVASLGTTIGASALLGGIPGLIAGVGLGAGIGLWTDAGNEEIKKNSALRKYLYKNSSKFIDSFESNNDRGIAGFSRKESGEAANFVRTMNDEFFIKDDEMMVLMQKYTEGGLLKDSKDLTTFKEKMSSLTKTVKEGALMLNETYDNIADLLAEMRKAGINEKNWTDLMASGSVLGGLTGEDGSQLVTNLLDFVKNLNAGTGNSNEASMGRLENTLAYVSKYFDELESKKEKDLTFQEASNKDMIKNLGGKTEAAKYILASMEKMTEQEAFTTPALYFFDYNSTSKDFELNRESFKKYKNGNVTLQEAYDEAQRKLQAYEQEGNGDAIIKWKNSGSDYAKRYLKDQDLTDALSSTVHMYAENPNLKAQGFDIRSIMAEYFKVSDTGTQNLLEGFWQNQSANPDYMRKISLQKIWQRQTSETLSKVPSLTEWIGSKWEGFKDGATSLFTSIDQGIGNFMHWAWDGITGVNKKIPARFDKEFTTRSDIKSVSFDNLQKETKQSNDVFAVGYSGVKALESKGYSVDPTLLSFLEKKFNTTDKSVDFKREIISNWGEVSEDLSKNRKTITDQAEKNSLSETIVAALHKYNTGKVDSQKLDISSTVAELGNQNVNYGGNTGLALAATFSSNEVVDSKLKELGYNMTVLRSAGAQEVVDKIDINSLGLEEGITNKVNQILKTNISVNGTTPTTTTQEPGRKLTRNELVNHDLREASNVTAEQLNQFIESRTKDKPNSVLKGQGQTIIDAAKKYNIDPLFALAQMGEESGWGNSSITRDKYNFNGWGAYTNNPNNATRYGSAKEGIEKAIENVSKYYIHGSENQNTLEKFNRSKTGHNYTDEADKSAYARRIAQIMEEAINELGITYGGKTVTKDGKQVYNGHGVSTTKEDVSVGGGGSKSEQMKLENNITESLDRIKGNEESKKISKLRTLIQEQSPMISDLIQVRGRKNIDATQDKYNEKMELLTEKISKITGQNVDSNVAGVKNYMEDFYNTNKQLIAAFARGRENDQGYKEWNSKSTAEKSEIFELVKTIEKMINPNGKGIIKNELKGDQRNIYNEQEKEDLENINREGQSTYTSKNKNSNSENHTKYLAEGKKRFISYMDEDYEKYREILKGSKAEVTGYTTAQDKFIEKASQTKELYLEANKNQEKERIPLLRKDLEKSYQFEELKSSKDKSDIEPMIIEYLGKVDKLIGTGNYKNINEVVEKNPEVKKQREEIVGKYNKNGEQKLGEIEQREFKVNKKMGEKTDIMDSFARDFLGINKDQYGNDITKYNMEVMGRARTFYNDNMNAMHAYVYGDKNSEQAQKWAKMDLVEKNNTVEMLKLLAEPLGKNKGSEINTVDKMEYNLRTHKKTTLDEELTSKSEKEVLKHLRKNEDGKFIFDMDYNADNEEKEEDRKRTLNDYNEWRKQGQRVSDNRTMENKLKELTGKEIDINSKSTFQDLSNLISAEMQKIVAENQKHVSTIYDETDKILNGTEKGTQHLSASKKNELIGALKGGDVEYLKNFNANNEGSEISQEVLNRYIELAEAINGVDLQGFQEMINMIEELKDISKDTANTSLLLRDSFDEATQKEFETKVRNNIATVFEKDSEMGQAIQNNATLDEIAKLLHDGGVGEIAGKEVRLSSDDTQTLATAVAGAIDETIGEILKDNKKLDEFESSEIFKIVDQYMEKNGKTIEVDTQNAKGKASNRDEAGEIKKDSKSLDEAVTILNEVNTKLKENAGKNKEEEQRLESERSNITEQIQTIIGEAVQDSGKIAEHLKLQEEKVTAATESSTKNADTFASTMAAYDESIGKAITTMNNRINTLASDLSSLNTTVSNLPTVSQ